MTMRETRWKPDTHPSYEFVYSYDDNDAGKPDYDPWNHCSKALKDGVLQSDPPAVYQKVLDENRMKNRAEAMIVSMLPAQYLKPEVDGDGDLTGSFVVKAKHAPVWVFGEADGHVDFSIPGVDDDTKIAIRAALKEAFEDGVSLTD